MFFLIFWKEDVAKNYPKKKKKTTTTTLVWGFRWLLPQAVLKSLALLLWENRQLMVLIWKMAITASPYGKDPSMGIAILRIRALGWGDSRMIGGPLFWECRQPCDFTNNWLDFLFFGGDNFVEKARRPFKWSSPSLFDMLLMTGGGLGTWCSPCDLPS